MVMMVGESRCVSSDSGVRRRHHHRGDGGGAEQLCIVEGDLHSG